MKIRNSLTEQISRCESLLQDHRVGASLLGRSGQFGQLMIMTALDNGRAALATGRASTMREMVAELRGLK